MSLHHHLTQYHGDTWKDNFLYINAIFMTRPPMTFTIWPNEIEIVGRPCIGPTEIAVTFTMIPDTFYMMPMVDYYQQMFNYKIKYPNERAICFNFDPFTYYPSELIYIDDLEDHTEHLTNPFTYVV